MNEIEHFNSFAGLFLDQSDETVALKETDAAMNAARLSNSSKV